MSENILIVVDMQNDFISGNLGNEEAEKIVETVIKKVKNFQGRVIFTKDTHYDNYLDTQEGKNLPIVHCIKNTRGWEIADGIKELIEEKRAEVFEKSSFGSEALIKRLREIDEKEKIENITLIGICTDICVVSNALAIRTFLPEVPVKVDSSCCAGVTKEKHEAALETMRSCQIEVI